jgi:oligopeptide transport system ATP-binding protein
VDSETHERLVPIKGNPINMLNAPDGCRLASRCDHCMKICLRASPPLISLSDTHEVACWQQINNASAVKA